MEHFFSLFYYICRDIISQRFFSFNRVDTMAVTWCTRYSYFLPLTTNSSRSGWGYFPYILAISLSYSHYFLLLYNFVRKVNKLQKFAKNKCQWSQLGWFMFTIFSYCRIWTPRQTLGNEHDMFSCFISFFLVVLTLLLVIRESSLAIEKIIFYFRCL